MTPKVVLEAQAGIGESPVWHAARRALFWVDIPARKVHSYDPASGGTRSWSVPEEVGCVAPMADGALLIALRSSFQRLDPVDGSLKRLWSTDEEPKGNRFNDGKTDRQGRFWCGSMDAAEQLPTGALYRLGSDLECERLVTGIICSNALCWSPDGTVMYYGDSNSHVVWAWDFDPRSGAIANRRVFLEIPSSEGLPDGATVDSEGYVWLAQWGGWRVTRYDPRGRVDRVIALPVSQPACAAFGGPDLATLYITTARSGITPADLTRQPLAGALFAVEVDATGIPEVPFPYPEV
jgi:sugar lactone lactonase YvrE